MARTTSFWGIFISEQMSRAWLATGLCKATVSWARSCLWSWLCQALQHLRFTKKVLAMQEKEIIENPESWMGIWIRHHRPQLHFSTYIRAGEPQWGMKVSSETTSLSAQHLPVIPVQCKCLCRIGTWGFPALGQELLSELFCGFLLPWQLPLQLSSHPTCFKFLK